MTEMDRVSPYMLWRSPFFEVAWAPGSPFLRTPIRPEGPIPGWVGRDAGPWSTWAPLAPAEPLPRQGWKIHVSALPRDAAAVVGAAARICREQGVAHKMLRTRELVLASQLKYADPVSSRGRSSRATRPLGDSRPWPCGSPMSCRACRTHRSKASRTWPGRR